MFLCFVVTDEIIQKENAGFYSVQCLSELNFAARDFFISNGWNSNLRKTLMAEKKGVDKVTFGKSKGIFVRVTELPRVADIGVAP